jgi:hypothetical protein
VRLSVYASQSQCLQKRGWSRWVSEHPQLSTGVRTGKLVDGPRESWKPDLKVVRASIRFLYQTGRLSRSSDVRVLTNLSGHEC